MKLFGLRVLFASPQKADIVFFDECNSRYLTHVINTDLSFTTLNLRPPILYISLPVLRCFFLSLRYFNIRSILRRKKSLLHSIFWEFLPYILMPVFLLLHQKQLSLLSIIHHSFTIFHRSTNDPFSQFRMAPDFVMQFHPSQSTFSISSVGAHLNPSCTNHLALPLKMHILLVL